MNVCICVYKHGLVNYFFFPGDVGLDREPDWAPTWTPDGEVYEFVWQDLPKKEAAAKPISRGGPFFMEQVGHEYSYCQLLQVFWGCGG